MTFFTQHEAILAIIGYWVFSAIVGGMPQPDENSSKGYVWMFNSLHLLAGNLTSVVSARYPVIAGESTARKDEALKP